MGTEKLTERKIAKAMIASHPYKFNLLSTNHLKMLIKFIFDPNKSLNYLLPIDN